MKILTRRRLGYWSTLECLEGEGAYHDAPPPLLSREPLVIESRRERARRHLNALHKTHPKHPSELKIEVACEVKVSSNAKIRRFDVLGPGDNDYRLYDSNSGKMFSYALLRYGMSIDRILRKGQRQGQVSKSCDTCFMTQFWWRTRKVAVIIILYYST